MGSVTATVTDSINDMFQTQSLHFESYEDFVKYENAATAAQPENNIYLTDDEIYTLRVLLGHVVDKECSSVAEKLELLDEYELDCEDYDKLYIEMFIDEDKHVLEDGSKDLTIKFKN